MPLGGENNNFVLQLLAHSGPFLSYALPSAFIRSYFAFKSSAGVGPFGATGAANARRTGGIGFPASTRFSHISRISLASRSIFLAQLAISSAAPRALDRCDNKPASAMGTARCSDNETPACATSSIQPSRQQW